LKAAFEVSQILCAEEEECPGGPFTIEELCWAMTVYFHYNIQDQVIVPFVTFARFTARNFGIEVKMNRKTGGLDVLSNDHFSAGDEIGIYYPRGPGGQLVARGTFDPSAVGVDSGIDVRTSLSSSTGRRICVDHAHELMFGSNGRPRAALVKCYAWLIANDDERLQIDSHASDHRWMERVYKGLESTVEEALGKVPARGACMSTNVALQQDLERLNEFTRKVLSENLAFLKLQRRNV
jgi:hypothetical protein